MRGHVAVQASRLTTATRPGGRGIAAAHFLGFVFATLLLAAPAEAQPQPLTPVVEATPASGEAPLTVLFYGTGSTGKWGNINSIDSWGWDLAHDGTTFRPDASFLDNATVAYTYDRPGTHTARLRVTDTLPDGTVREAFADVKIEVAPSSRDPGVKSDYPPGAWGAGINAVWAKPQDLVDAAGFVQPVRQILLTWEMVEPLQQGQYDWAKLDDELQQAAAASQKVGVQINSDLPDWVFHHIAKTGTARNLPSPQFWDPDYIDYYEQLISALASHLASSPHLGLVLYVRQQWNAVHTETTFYDSTTNGDAMGTWVNNPSWVWPTDGHKYQVAWTEDLATAYERRIFDSYLDSFRPLHVGVTLRSTESHVPDDEKLAFYTKGDPTAWTLKTNNRFTKWSERGHVDEFQIMRCFGALGVVETWGTAEDRIAAHNPELSVEQDIYGVVLRALEIGTPHIAMYGSDVAKAASNEDVRGAFRFANKHAGWYRFPRSAPGAWLVLGHFEGSTTWEKANALARDNWGAFLRQNDPSETSTALTSVGDPSCRFGLVARRIDQPATFDLDDSFAEAASGDTVTVRVVHQTSEGSLTLKADRSGVLETVLPSGTSSYKGWTLSEYSIVEPAFAGGPDNRTDLVLEPASGAPVVHLLEVDRDFAGPGWPDAGAPEGGVWPEGGVSPDAAPDDALPGDGGPDAKSDSGTAGASGGGAGPATQESESDGGCQCKVGGVGRSRVPVGTTLFFLAVVLGRVVGTVRVHKGSGRLPRTGSR